MENLFEIIERHDMNAFIKVVNGDDGIIYERVLVGSCYRNALNQAVVCNWIEACEILMDYKVKSLGYGGKPDLNFACLNGNYSIFRILLGYGCKPLVKGIINSNPILHDAVVGRNMVIIDELLQMGYNIEMEDTQGCTALCEAVRLGYMDVVVYLFEKGANINHQTKLKKPLIIIYGREKYFRATPLHIAVINGDLTIIKFLSKRASFKTQRGDGTTLWQDASTNIDNIMGIQRIGCQGPKVDFDMDHYKAYWGDLLFDYRDINSKFGTPLEIAVKSRSFVVSEKIIERCQPKHNRVGY